MPSLSCARAELARVGIVDTDEDLLSYALSMLLGYEDADVAQQDVMGLLPELGDLSSAVRDEVLRGLCAAARESEAPLPAATAIPPLPPVPTQQQQQQQQQEQEQLQPREEEEEWEVWLGEEDPGKDEEYQDDHAEGDQALRLLSAVLLLQEGASGRAFSPDAIYAAAAAAAEHGVADRAEWLLQEAQRRCLAARPCRHAMQREGGCLLHGCAFDHNLSNLPCRFWLLPGEGCLLQGQGSCPFAHGPKAMFLLLASLPPESPARQQGVPCSEEHFPSLGGGTAERGRGAVGRALGAGFREALFTQSQPLSSSNAGNGNAAKGGATSFTRIGGGGSGSGATRGSAGFGAEAWVEGGKGLSRDYAAVRAEARTLALARNRLLEEATKAFVSGNGAAARAASQRGKELNAQMHAAHEAAALLLFRQRNPSGGGGGTVDLHGLHVAEALALLEGGLLDQCRREQQKRGGGGRLSVRLVTGSGHHSHQAGRLLPAVTDWLARNGCHFVEVKDPGGHTGGVAVSL